MARIRTIKPEFFTSEDIVSLSPLARLFYVSLWCEADREGRLEWKPRTLKMRYLPADDCDINELGKELIDGGMVFLYESDQRTYAHIPGFKRHQVINNREQESDIPAPNTENTQEAPRADDASLTRESGRKERKERKGTEDASRGDGDACADSASPQIQNPTPAGAICKRIRQEAGFTRVQPADPSLLKLLEAGYTDDELVAVCKEAVAGGKSWPWVVAVVQARRSDAAKIAKAPDQTDRMSKFAGAI